MKSNLWSPCLGFILLFSLLNSEQALSHSRSKGKSVFKLSADGYLKIQIGMTTLDFLDLSNIDLASPNEQGKKRLQSEEFLTNYFPKYLKIQLEPSNVRCRVVYEKMVLPDHKNIELFVFAQCAQSAFQKAKFIRIDWGLFTGTLLMHRSFTSFLWGDGYQQNWVFSRRASTKTLALEKPNALSAAVSFLHEGFWHFVTGYDHFCFLLLLFLACTQIKILILWVSGFTVAHGVALLISYFDLVRIPTWLVEAGIALTILLTALHLLFSQKQSMEKSGSSWLHFLIVISFGVIHGLGFSYLLKELLSESPFLWLGIFSFHIGLETAQILFLILFGIITWQLKKHRNWLWIQNFIVSGIVILSLFWLYERVF